ncbi:N-acetylmuramoyl-L-alanine amidase, partial [bacterium]|nr:N-acetylmuramoyl-L-alanine amidase [bacterium]
MVFLSEPPAMAEQRRNQEQIEISRLKAGKIKIVVIDPGHGGEDPGARHGNIVEKNYVLMMAQMVKAFFDRDPRYKAILTRSGDYIIPLEKRPQIAEHLGADVFASIHVNFNKKRAIQGFEVYYESPKGAVGQAEHLVAENENQQDALGGVGTVIPSFNGLDKKSIVQKQASIMFKSRQFAEKVSFRFSQIPGLLNRGVKRAGFKVLHS